MAIVTAMRAAGLSVWWDEGVTPRQAWDVIIEQEIAAATSVVVLWSLRSITSDWVRTEAHYAQNHAKLVPVLIEPCTVPLAFMLKQAIDLSRWHGSREDPEWRKLMEWLDAGSQVTNAPPSPERIRRRRLGKAGATSVIAAFLIAGLLAAALVYRSDIKQPTDPSIRVASFKTPPDDQVAAAFSQGFAADLAQIVVRGGSRLKVIDASDGVNAHADANDFTLNGSVRSAAGTLRATLTLNSVADGAIIWSSSLAGPVADADALHQEAETRMGAVFVCALGRDTRNRSIVSLDALKIYLQACESIPTYDILQDRKLLRDVVALAPNFADGWSQLAVCNAFITGNGAADIDVARTQALDAAARALAIDPRNAAAWVARAMVHIKFSEWSTEQADMTKALALDPDEPIGNLFNATSLVNVGRLGDALEYAMRAANSGPPLAQKTIKVVTILADLGRLDEAQSMLAAARKTWPDDGNVNDFAARMAAWYDDPKQVGKTLDDPAIKANVPAARLQLFRLEAAARADPSVTHVEAAVRLIRATFAGADNAYAAAVNFMAIGRTDDAYAAIAGVPLTFTNTTYGQNPSWLFRPYAASFRADPRFMSLVAKIGLVAVWKATKWPDFCNASDVPYDCRTVAAKPDR